MKSIKKFTSSKAFTLSVLFGLIFLSGCARYARDINALYEPTATAHSGSGEVYIHIPESQQTGSANIRWVLGEVKDDNNIKLDEIYSPRSPAELVQGALTQELRTTGYTVTPIVKPSGAEKKVIEITKSEIELEQVSVFTDLKVTCRVVVGLELFKNGQLLKKVQYEAMSSRTDIKDRDLLARNALQSALQLVMQRAIPELNDLFNKQ